jgi:FlaA1/EpsC-like NDP-sugar epimerase
MKGNQFMAWSSTLSSHRRWLVVCGHIFLLAFTYYASFLLRFDFLISYQYRLLFLETLPILLLVKVPILSFTGLLRGWWRYAGIADLLDILRAATASSLLIFLTLRLFFPHSGFPRSVLLIDLLLTICTLGGVRVSVRIYQETSGRNVPRKNTLIVGAGQAGSRIARELKNNSQLDLNPVGCVDDDDTKRGIKIQGVRVVGKIADLPKLVERYRAACILIAMPSVHGAALGSIVERCNRCSVELKILPSIGDRINGIPAASKVRSVRIDDLLGRTPVCLDMAAIRQRLADKVLMITGAGGSIGSELARQLADFRPRKLVLFERAENELHSIDLEIQTCQPGLQYVPVVGDILDVRTLREVMAEHRPHFVFHAAAYKHVPMMEKNCFQAVVNNVFGTYNVALVAKQYGVEDFLMISSDKAVNPTNIMGVTKRIAELVILGLQHQHTCFVSVRFGNVLGSNGSVLPLFEQQLAHGGPLTVTHPDAQRYFMTIPEAVQLVLQASTMGKGGEIFLLDMGAPVRIADLATNLIRLSGLDPERDVRIVYTGLRPGEKLFEELKLDGEGIKQTSHPKIRVLDGGTVNFSEVVSWLDDLSALVEAKSVFGLVRKLQEIVPEYTPSPELLSLCEFDRHDLFSGYRRAQVELFRTANLELPARLDTSRVA